MQPVRVSHNIVPKRPDGLPPPASPASLRRVPRQAACPAFRGVAVPQLAVDFQAAPTVSMTTQLQRPCTPTALGFGLDMAQAMPSSDAGMAPPTPTNSCRRSSDAAVVMMPRSSRSMRQHVLQARNAEEVDAVAEPELLGSSMMLARQMTPSSSSTPAARRASFSGVVSLGSEVVQGSVGSMWNTNGLSTPKNSDRRDLAGSVQQNVPLWRGSAVATEAYQPTLNLISSPTRPASRMGYTRRDSVPMAPTSVLTVAQAAPVCVKEEVRPSTADSSERKWRPMPIEVDPGAST